MKVMAASATCAANERQAMATKSDVFYRRSYFWAVRFRARKPIHPTFGLGREQTFKRLVLLTISDMSQFLRLIA